MIHLFLLQFLDCQPISDQPMIVTEQLNSQQVDRFEDKYWDEIKMPIKVDVYEQLLIKSRCDKDKTRFLVNGFRKGFGIGYERPQCRQDTSRNLPLKNLGTKIDLWNKVMKEVKVGRVAGPYKMEDLPFKNFIQSPIGLVPKAGGQTRLIFHLSYHFDKSQNLSLNACMPKEKTKVKYNDIDLVVQNCLDLLEEGGINSSIIFFGKSDLKSAFRILSIWPAHRQWLLMKAEDPDTGEVFYFIDKCLPFGASISCALFQEFSDSLKHLVEFLISHNKKKSITNYLDDFLFIALLKSHCDHMWKKFMELCELINCPISMDKTEWGSITMVFLGILLDGKNHCLMIPEDKRVKALNLLREVVDKKKVTVKEIECLTGYSNFLNKAIAPGRAFTRRMYAQMSCTTKNGVKLKQYHHVSLKKEFRDDCLMWIQFLELVEWDKKQLAHPFLDLHIFQTSEQLRFYTDASGTIGFGCFFDG